uniref:amino acid ABC transporter permease n=1 Tax=Castellaniella defragrans TaxID=75697 RepID=UPI00334035D0
MNYDFSFTFLIGYSDALFGGLKTTLALTTLCTALGLVLGFATNLARQSKNRLLVLVTSAYVEIFRGTPVLVQLFWFFFCLPLLLRTELSNFVSATLALTLYMGAISSESYRAAMQTIPPEQYQACIALGIRKRIETLYVVLPQTLMRAVPTLLSNCVTLFKESALVSAVGMSDLMYIGQNISNSTARPVEVLSATAIIYFIIAFPMTRLVTRMERRIRQRLAI